MGLEDTPIAKDGGKKIYSVRKLIPSGIPHSLMADFDFISGRGIGMGSKRFEYLLETRKGLTCAEIDKFFTKNIRRHV